MSRKPKTIPVLSGHRAQPPLTDFGSDATQVALSRRWAPNMIAVAEREMMAILRSAGLPANATYRDLRQLQRQHRVGSECWYAAEIVDHIASIRGAMAGANPDEILHAALHLGALMKEASIVVPDGHIFDFGVKMDAGRKRPRQDALARLIVEAQERLGRDASAEAVLSHIAESQDASVDSDKSIAWADAHGRPKTSTFKALQNRLSTARKRAGKARPARPQK
jgi:hypothetical protein